VLGALDPMAAGVDSYDRMTRRLRDEVVRAHEFARPFALLMLRSLDRDAARVGRVAECLSSALRSVDTLGIYDDRTAMVLMPELGADAAREAATRLLSAGAAVGLELGGGLAVYPDAAASHEELLAHCRRACLRASSTEPLVLAGTARAARSEAPANIVIQEPSMQALYRMLRQIAPRGLPVLIVGETGVGKEVIAAALHRASDRQGPLKVINCATIPQTLTESILFGHEKGAFTGAAQRATGLFEEAQGGTVFLDEIGELGASAQAALLRVLQEKRIMRVGSTRELEVDVRVVAATHRNLEAMADAGTFRKDLLYRLNAVTLEVPPLRERTSEIAALAQGFLDAAIAEWGGTARGFSHEVLALLEAYAWPGNVRQLRNVVERAAALCERKQIEPIDLPSALRGADDAGPSSAGPKTLMPPPTVPASAEAAAAASARANDGDDGASEEGDADFKLRVRDFEVGLIRDALDKSQGNLTRAAELLRMPIRTLTYKLKAFGIKAR
jgi:DNA-binding NtrC family response regulator